MSKVWKKGRLGSMIAKGGGTVTKTKELEHCKVGKRPEKEPPDLLRMGIEYSLRREVGKRRQILRI